MFELIVGGRLRRPAQREKHLAGLLDQAWKEAFSLRCKLDNDHPERTDQIEEANFVLSFIEQASMHIHSLMRLQKDQ